MTSDNFYGHLRERIGNPNPKDVTQRQLASFVASGLQWLADQLEFQVKTDTLSFVLEEDVREITLPQDLAEIISVDWNDTPLTPTSVWKLERENSNWRTADGSAPSEYAIQARKLILFPPPSDDAVDDDDTLTVRYIAAAPAMGESGPVGLNEMDQWLAIYRAALEYLRFHPSDVNAALMRGCEAEIAERLPRARKRAMNAHATYLATLQPETSGRMGGAR